VKTTSEALLLHLLVRSFCGNSAALYVGSVRRLERGFEVQIRFLRSKTMILFTCRLMPADLRLQSDRETQKSDIYFTNHTLTGKPNAFPFQESESGLAARVGLLVKLLFAGCLPYLFHQSHFDWEKDASPSPGLDSARRFRRPRCQ
jgi:hypothetical protein